MNSNATLELLACQIDIPSMITSAEQAAHLKRSVDLVQRAIDSHPANSVDLVVLPELSSLDYSRAAFEQLDTLAENHDGPSFEHWSEFAKSNHCWVIYGFARRTDDGFRIASAIVSSTGLLAGVYDKLHLAQFGDSMEKEYFSTPGEHLVVVDIKGFRVAPIICYDIRAPELCRTLALDHQVDIITHVGAYARDPSFYSWHAFATTRAVENQCYFLSLNRAGSHFGHSVFCPPWIDETQPPETFAEHTEECRRLTVSRETINTARKEYTFLDDKLASYQLPVIGS